MTTLTHKLTHIIPLIAAFIAVLIGLVAFALNWLIWGGGMPGFQYLLYPGTLVLSFFSEEIDLWPKLVLHLIGQFFVIYLLTLNIVLVVGKLTQKRR